MSQPQTEHGLDASIDEFGENLRAALIEAGTGELGNSGRLLYATVVSYHGKIGDLETKLAQYEPSETPTT